MVWCGVSVSVFPPSLQFSSPPLPQGTHYRQGETPLMRLEVLLFYVEVIYLWRALPFCSTDVKRQLLEKLSAPLPAGAQPVHQAMRAWLKGGILNALDQPIEAEKVGRQNVTLLV